MLCLDIKLVSRLRGVSLTSGSSTNVSAVSLSVSSTSSTTVGIEKKNFSSKRSKGGRESCAGNGNSVTESDSDEETLPASRTIQRNRSRSVCVPTLSSAARCAHLHRRSSHHALYHASCKILSNAVKYCQVLSNAVKCCQMLSNAVRCCKMLSNAVKCCQMLSNAVKCC
ncbi:uncharacterized protein LOC143304606 isoform X1 [Bombus vancouverensis nearcticus]